MTILQITPLESGYHPYQSQSHRTACWLDGWIAVPEELETALDDCLGFCEPIIEDGVLVDIVPGERPEAETLPSWEEDIEALLIDQEYRLTLLELGVM